MKPLQAGVYSKIGLDWIRANLKRLALTLALMGIYAVTFPLIVKELGEISAALAAIPVVLAGWYFGMAGGVIASLSALLLNTMVFAALFGHDIDGALSNHWPGNVMLILVGLVAGNLKQAFDKRLQVENQLRRRERYLSIIGISTQDILGSANMATKYHRLTHHLANMLVADYGHLIIWDEKLNRGIRVGTTQEDTGDVLLNPHESSIVATILQQGEATGIEHKVNPELLITSIISELNSHIPEAVIYIPIATKEYRLGVVLLAYNVYHNFTSEEFFYANLAGQQIALALKDAKQKAEIQQHLREERSLAEISRALSETGRIGLDNVLQSIADSARDLLPGAEQVVIHLLDEDKQILNPRAVVGFEDVGHGKLNMRLGEGVAGQVILEGQAINIADVDEDPRLLREKFLPRFRSLLVCPIQSGEERLGTISVQSGNPNAFSADEERLLGLLSIDAAIAIENARLLEVTQQGLKEVNALYRATRELASSLNPAELMRNVVDLLHENFGYYHVQIYMREEETGNLLIAQGAGEIGASLMVNKHRIPVGKGITGHVAATGQPFLTNDVESTPFYLPNPLLPKTRSELCVPIKINNRVVGVLNVEQDSNSSWLTDRDMQLVSTVAEQLSVALQKADLYANLQFSLQEEKRMRTQLVQNERLAVVGRLLASVSHELNNPLQAIQNALFLLKEEHGISTQGRQDLDIILSETERMAGLIERLRSSYRPTQTVDFQPVQINALLEDVHSLVATHLRHNKIAFEFHPDPELTAISGLPDQLKQVTLNLVMNAVEAMPHGGRLKIATAGKGNEICFSIMDTGPGIHPDMLPTIFDPFVTSKETGTGLGLTISYDIVQRHNGRIVAENAPEGGAVFTVWLPIHKQEIP